MSWKVVRERLWLNQEPLWRNEPEEPWSEGRKRQAAPGLSMDSASLPHRTSREIPRRDKDQRWHQVARPVVR